MADPVFEDINEGAWKKIATNVTSGMVRKVDTSPDKYLQTYRDTGGAAPTLLTEGFPVFVESDSVPISSNIGIDVYLWAIGSDGRVRVDL